MKKLILSMLVILFTIVLTIGVFGQSAQELSDVQDNAWYSQGVEDVSEAGLMSVNAGLFQPDAPFTVDTALVASARLHVIINNGGTSVANVSDARSYLQGKGVPTDVLSLSDTQAITRGDFALLLYGVVGDLEKTNASTYAADIVGTKYESAVLSLYGAGVLTGFDASGTFLPEQTMTRAQGAVALSRVVNIFDRKETDYSKLDSREAFYLIDDFMTSVTPRSKTSTGSGWVYDWAGDVSRVNNTGRYQNELHDYSGESYVAMYREFFPQNDGVLTLETNFRIMNGTNGARIYFSDSKGNMVCEFVTKNNYFYIVGANEYKTSWKATSGTLYPIKLVVDLDNNTTEAYICGQYLGVVNNNVTDNAVTCVTFGTTVNDIIITKPEQVHLYKNYSVNERFRLIPTSDTASYKTDEHLGWTVSGSVVPYEIHSDGNNKGDLYSAKFANNSSMTWAFEPLTGKVSAQTYVLMPETTSGAYFVLKSGTKDVIGVYADGGKFKMGTTELRDFSANIWQLIKIEADLDKGTAVIKIDGKIVAENIKISADSIDGVSVQYNNDTESYMLADDILVNNMYDYADYVPEPKRLDTGDYILSMSVCNLWRNGSHYGWDAISPYDELTPVTGYYDEGNIESMDWEIKYLVEHGISTYHMCWYAPMDAPDEPIKKPRMVDAFHDGYFNAKYSDMLDFSIMFENANQSNTTIQQFKDSIWAYWKEWYFSDERYFTIDNKPYLTVYQMKNFLNMSKKATQEEKIAEIAELIAWMKEDIKSLGYDGLIFTFSDFGRSAANNAIYAQLGVDGLVGYAVGTTGYNLEVNKTLINQGYTIAKESGVDSLSLAGTGFNIIGWNQLRTPLMTPADFNKLLTWFRDEHMPLVGTGSDWKSRFIQFDTWNEYGEGHYLFPTNTYGFEYLDEIAKVFATNPSEYSTDVNTVPTDVQVDRMNRLYPGNNVPLRRQLLEKGEQLIPESVVWSYDFTNESNYTRRYSFPSYTYTPKFHYAGITGTYNKTDKCFVGITTNTDPMIYPMEDYTARNVLFSAEDADVIHFRLWADALVTGTVYFATDSNTTLNEDKAFSFGTTEKNKFVDYYIETSQNQYWTGGITALRLDPGGFKDVNIKLEVLETLTYSEEQKPFKISVDGMLANNTFDETSDYNEYEFYASVHVNQGILTLLKLTTEWNPNTGVLSLRSPNGTTFKFTVGSDVALVNGNRVALEKAVTTFDGVPTIPIVFILKHGGYDYIYDYTNRIIQAWVITNNYKKQEIVECDAEDQTNGFYATDVFTANVVTDYQKADNKVLSITGANQQKWAYLRQHFDFQKGDTYIVNFDVRVDGLNNGQSSPNKHSVYFNPRYADSALESGKYDHQALVLSMDETDGWEHASYEFTIPDTYLDTYADEQLSIFISPVKLSDGSYTTVNYSIDNFTLHKKTPAFEIVNGDAEGTETKAFYCNSKTNTVAIVEDPYDSTNKVWGLTIGGSDYPYIRTKTAFETGITYEIEFDMCVTTLSDGSDANNIKVSVNPRYVDAMQLNITNKYDHNGDINEGVMTLSKADGWKHFKRSFTIKQSRMPVNSELGSEQLTFFANPPGGLGVNFMIDNVTVRVVE